MSADDKEIFDFSNYSTKSKYYDDSNKLVIDKMKYEGATGESVGLKSKMCSILVDGNSEHKKAKHVIEILLPQQVITNIMMYYSITNV